MTAGSPVEPAVLEKNISVSICLKKPTKDSEVAGNRLSICPKRMGHVKYSYNENRMIVPFSLTKEYNTMSLCKFFAFGCVLVLFMSTSSAQTPVAPANYDEEKVGNFPLTDPLKTKDGQNVNTPELWENVRRPELLKLFANEMFGRMPLPPGRAIELPTAFSSGYHSEEPSRIVFNGKGTRHQFRLHLARVDGEANREVTKIDVLIYTPNNVTGKIPAFLGLNFQGNHTVDADPGIYLGTVWQDGKPVPATKEERGSQSSRWQIEKILDRGYAVITAYYQEIEPDFNGGSTHGIRQLIDQQGEPNEGNAIATWAWGLSLIRENIETRLSRLIIDPDKIIVIGHSRLGKTALWAAAVDERFAMAISNNSGCGGAALSRRNFGETVPRINTTFPHWFNDNFKKYNFDVDSLPFDQHELIALIAPRPVYIASAVEDRWADPKGEFLSGLYADPVYRLLGTDGFAGVKAMPELNKSAGGTIGYHIRSGEHDVTEFDWEQFLNFADKHFK